MLASVFLHLPRRDDLSTNKSNDEGNGFNEKDAFEVNKGFVMTLRTRTGNFGVNTLFYSDCGLDSSLNRCLFNCIHEHEFKHISTTILSSNIIVSFIDPFSSVILSQ